MQGGIISFETLNTAEHIIKSCTFKSGEQTEVLYFKFLKKYASELTEMADPWVILCMHKMMRVGGDFCVRGAVSSSLMRNLENYCQCWQMIMPHYKPINIIPDVEVHDEVKPLENKAIMTFSGGLDASFTLFRHKTGRAGRNTKNIEKAILLFGAGDTPLDRPDEFKLHAENARALCDDMGVEFLTVETNFCKFDNDWEMEHFNVIVAALYFFENYPYKMTASTITVSSVSYGTRMPWSSNPITDLMLSSNSACVVSDDVAYDRTMKANVVKDWELATEKMRVCWEGNDKSKNCGKCEKCIRTMLNFIACGVSQPLKMFPAEAYVNMFENAQRFTHYPRWQYLDLLKRCQENPTVDDKYIELIQNILNSKPRKNKKHSHSFWWHLRHMKF